MAYAFTFDASACSGCKACQVACKDKNNLPVGVLWRRVYEVSGGSWRQVGNAWVTDVFAYNLSIACNHCAHPKCAGVCPTDAFVTRPDGIVYIDESKCIGCGYCSWACHYAAPQYDPGRGYMTKCDFCYDYLDAGLTPACVAACPLRALDFMTVFPAQGGEGQGRRVEPVETVRELWQIPASEHPFPLPNQSRTEPHLAVKPHSAMSNRLEKTVSNREEVQPKKTKSELPLLAFTLLGQMAAGMAFFSLFSGPLTASVLAALGALIGLAGLASWFHLGSPGSAWRAVIHFKKSWLSREILAFGLFGASWLVCLVLPGMGKLLLALSGTWLVYSMTQVYRLRSVPAWDTERTTLAFFASGVLLGSLGLKTIALFANTGIAFPPSDLVASAGLFITLLISLTERGQAHKWVNRLRLGLIGLGLAGVWIASDPVGRWFTVPIFIVVMIEEGLGRWLFYEQLSQRIL